ncbi:MAG: hypothetical protein Kow0049_12720 [Stanieria sp.]
MGFGLYSQNVIPVKLKKAIAITNQSPTLLPKPKLLIPQKLIGTNKIAILFKLYEVKFKLSCLLNQKPTNQKLKVYINKINFLKPFLKVRHTKFTSGRDRFF